MQWHIGVSDPFRKKILKFLPDTYHAQPSATRGVSITDSGHGTGRKGRA